MPPAIEVLMPENVREIPPPPIVPITPPQPPRTIIHEPRRPVAVTPIALDPLTAEQVQRRWRFRPALVDGRATRTRGIVPISFRVTHE